MKNLPTRPKTRILAALGAGAAVLAGTAACGSSSSTAAAVTSASTSPPASSTAASGGSSSSYPPTASATPTATACPTSQLSITASPVQGALSHAGSILKFVNTGQTCTLTGYPSVVAGSPGASNAVRAQVNRGGYIFHANTPAIVTLRPGGTASAGIEWLSAPKGSQQSCRTFSTLTVTPPHDTGTATLQQQLHICSGFEVHALVPGASGISGPPAP